MDFKSKKILSILTGIIEDLIKISPISSGEKNKINSILSGINETINTDTDTDKYIIVELIMAPSSNPISSYFSGAGGNQGNLKMITNKIYPTYTDAKEALDKHIVEEDLDNKALKQYNNIKNLGNLFDIDKINDKIRAGQPVLAMNFLIIPISKMLIYTGEIDMSVLDKN